MNLNRLSDPFDPFAIEWRVQMAGSKDKKTWALVVPYITNRAIQERLDIVCEPQNWRNEFTYPTDKSVLCGISIRVNDEWVTKWDGAEETDIEAVKGGLSNAMKRAAVQWGIGRYLYDLEQVFVTWTDQDPRNNDYLMAQVKIDGRKQRIWFKRPNLPAFAMPKED